MLFCEADPYQNSSDSSVHPVFRGRKHIHLMATDPLELNVYAQSIGLPLRWLQRDRHSVPHFDVTGKYMARVLGDRLVVKMDRRTFVATFQSLRPKTPKEQIMAAPKLTKPKKKKPPVPSIEECFLPEHIKALKSLLRDYTEIKAIAATAKVSIEGDDKEEQIGLRGEIIAVMKEYGVDAFQHQGIKWSIRQGSNATISREKLILAGVDLAIIVNCTSVSKFDVLSFDTITEEE